MTTGPGEVSVAMGQLAQMRADKIIAQVNSALPGPTFKPSIADLVVPPPTPAEAAQEMWTKLAPAQAVAERSAAIDLLRVAAGAKPARSPAPTWAPNPFNPNLVPPSPQHRMRLPAVAQGGGGASTTTQVTLTYGNTIAGVMIDAWKSYLTGAQYLEWVRMSKYPWWWGPITKGLAQVEAMLAFDNAYFQRSRLPAVTKALFSDNISRAMNFVREQRAAEAARRGGTPVPF